MLHDAEDIEIINIVSKYVVYIKKLSKLLQINIKIIKFIIKQHSRQQDEMIKPNDCKSHWNIFYSIRAGGRFLLCER